MAICTVSGPSSPGKKQADRRTVLQRPQWATALHSIQQKQGQSSRAAASKGRVTRGSGSKRDIGMHLLTHGKIALYSLFR